jgi:nucleoside-diphosphate-sugar epimerase
MDPASPQRCAVTGAAGYVGSAIARHFADRGWIVFEFTRRPPLNAVSNRVHVPFQLESPIDPGIFRDNNIRALIHCAYDFRPVKWKHIHRINVEGSARLLQAAKKAGVGRMIFLSSISAFEGCSSLYGKAKLGIERVAADLGACIIRPGLVYGTQSSGGMFGSLQRSVAGSSTIPLIGSGRYMQYLVHADDLCELILKLSSGAVQFPVAPLVAASPHGWQIRALLRALAAAQKKTVKLIPLPWQLVWLPLKALEIVGISPPFRSDSVISLVRQNPRPDFSLATQIGCRFRDFEPSLVPSATTPQC